MLLYILTVGKTIDGHAFVLRHWTMVKAILHFAGFASQQWTLCEFVAEGFKGSFSYYVSYYGSGRRRKRRFVAASSPTRSISNIIGCFIKTIIIGMTFRYSVVLRKWLFILVFPQFIAGPIVKYHDILHALEHNESHLADVAVRSRRFILNFGKKVLTANFLWRVADPIFRAGYTESDMGIVWLGAGAYLFLVLTYRCFI